MHRLIVILVFLLSPAMAGIVLAEQPATSMDAGVQEINRLLDEAWQRDQVVTADRSDDAEFGRRVWLDLAGVAPPVAEVREFLQDKTDDKRAKLIDRLLASPRHASHMAATWNDILLPSDVQTIEQRQNIAALQDWLRDQFVANTPYDYFVASFLTAGGAANRGPAIFYTTRDVEPRKIAAATSQIFLGVQLQCAECHDHPFDRWTQKDFWGYAAFFGQLARSEEQMNSGGLIIDRPDGDVTMPESDVVVSPRYPGASEPPDKDITNNRRRQLTIWMASRDNAYFARAAVNRVWGHLFGRGLVDPVDAMDKDNPASHPELLEFLTRYFVEHRFNLRTLIATIARSDAYQRSSAYDSAKRPPINSFATMNVKTLTARQFYDSVQQNVFRQSSALDANGIDNRREQFLARMRVTDTSPRDYPHGVMQALGLMNGPEMAQAIHPEQSGLLASLEAPFFNDDERIDAIFLAVLSRYPSDSESKRLAEFFSKAASEDDRATLRSDLVWTLLNTAEATVCP
ncbi:MAG: DUF1549 and DUF1553 domain-containing protein [Pirellulaceae bacterium]